MATRSNLSLGIVHLEERFAQEQDDVDFLNRLLHEFDHRTMKRVKNLRAQAVQAKVFTE